MILSAALLKHFQLAVLKVRIASDVCSGIDLAAVEIRQTGFNRYLQRVPDRSFV